MCTQHNTKHNISENTGIKTNRTCYNYYISQNNNTQNTHFRQQKEISENIPKKYNDVLENRMFLMYNISGNEFQQTHQCYFPENIASNNTITIKLHFRKHNNITETFDF